MLRAIECLWAEEAGFILSAETVLVGTLGVIGVTVGLSAAMRSVNEELTEVALAFRSLNQSYEVAGRQGCGAWTGASVFHQRPVEEAREELLSRVREDAERARLHEEHLLQRRELMEREFHEREHNEREHREREASEREASERHLKELQEREQQLRRELEQLESARKDEAARRKAAEKKAEQMKAEEKKAPEKKPQEKKSEEEQPAPKKKKEA